MIPIGIVTRNRVAYLNVTLRSLSATDMPEDVSVTVFDDCSSDDDTRRYYQTNESLIVETHWPSDDEWVNQLGLGFVNQVGSPIGIRDRVAVERISIKPLGVVNASCHAICSLFDRNPDAPGVFLLQDDVVFKSNWYRRMLDTVEKSNKDMDENIGLLGGIKLRRRLKFTGEPPAIVRCLVTAQCLYVSRELYLRLQSSFFSVTHKQSTRFDDRLRAATIKAGLWAGCIYPFVCQHIGIVSLVRPNKQWHQERGCRVGLYVTPPYAVADRVRRFNSCTD